MRNLKSRIAAIEAQRTPQKNRLPPDQEEAIHRIHEALRRALPIEDGLIRRPSACGRCFEFKPNPKAKYFEDCIRELNDRMTAGMMTEDDRRVLDSLPADDLMKVGITAEDIIKFHYEFYMMY